MSNYVLDASAILALLNNEPGSEVVMNHPTARRMGFLVYCLGSVRPIVVLLDKLTVVPLLESRRQYCTVSVSGV